MSAVLAPLVSFLIGLLAGGLVAWHARARPSSADAGPRLAAWRIVALTVAGTTLAIAALAAGLSRLVLRPRAASRATVEQAVADFRRQGGAGRPAAGGRVPEAGVYTYRATGFYEASAPVLGKERRDLPATVPGILVPDGDCWELAIRYFAEHEWKGRYCRGPEGTLRLVKAENRNRMFGMKTQGESRCTPDVVIPSAPRPGDTWKIACTSTPPRPEHRSGDVDLRAGYVGEETLTIDGRPVRAHHARRVFSMKGASSGVMEQESWHAVGSGMLVQQRVKGDGSGVARFTSDYRLTLRSLRPER